MSGPGALVVVGTPIGNLGDLSPRAASALAAADAIACEDTRRTGRLLSLAGIPAPPLLVTNEHTEQAQIERVLDRVAQGQRVAVVSDAGMPAISDPGRHLVAAVAQAGHQVEVVPGPVAATTALAASGFRAERFVFEGFLPRKGQARQQRLAAVVAEERTTVVYESPHRVGATLADLAQVCAPDRRVVVARELTKRFEELRRGTVAEVAAGLAGTELKGEVVVVIEGGRPPVVEVDDDALRRALRAEVGAGHSRRDAVDRVVDATGARRRRVYELANALDLHPDSSPDPDPDPGLGVS